MSQMTVRFVAHSGKQPSSVVKEAFEAMNELDFCDCEWFPENKCEEITERQSKIIYIFEEFHGPSFDYLRSTGNRIYGPICVLTCLKDSISLPKSPHPVFSKAMEGVLVSCTSIDRNVRDELHRRVQWMMGEVSTHFHEGVTHLVAGEVGSKKYIVASELKKHIMASDWVDAIWNASKQKFVTHKDPLLLTKHRCPLFKGFVITVSGIDSTERAHIKDVIEAEGGKYSGEMKVNECTHLVLKKPAGQKYEFACKWKLHIVSPQWLTDSVEVGYCLREYKYKVGNGESGNKPDNHSTPTGRTSSVTSVQDNSRLSNISAISITHVDESAFNMTGLTNTTIGRPSMFGGVGGGLGSGSDGEISRVQQSMMTDALDTTNVAAFKSDAAAAMVFDGCKMYISGFFGPRLEKVRKLVNLGGGIRFNDLTESVTHVIVGNVVDADKAKLLDMSQRPHVLKVEWLIDSIQGGKSMPEEAYFYPMDLPTPEAPLTVKKKSRLPSRQLDTSLAGSRDTTLRADEPAAAAKSKAKAQEDDMNDILSQYVMPPPKQPDSQASMSNMTDESALIRAAMDGEAQQQRPQTSQNDSHNDTTVLPEEEEEEEEEADGMSIFRRKTFVIFGFEKDAENGLTEFIKERKGKVLPMTSRGVPDFGVVPILGFPITRTVDQVVTNAWLQMCVERGQLLDPTSDPLFTPLEVDPTKQPLEGCTPSISGYAGTERDVLIHLAELAGATVQEFFVRVAKPKQQLQASTHLVVNAAAGGGKYAAAKKWKIPAVHKGWLIDSAQLGKKQPEEYYYLENPVPRPVADKDSTLNMSSIAPAHSTSSPIPSTSAAHTTPTTAEDTAKRKPSAKRSVVSESDMDVTMDTAAAASTTEQVDKENETAATSVIKDGSNGMAASTAVAMMAKNNRVKALISETLSSPKPQAPASPAPGVETPSKFLDPNKVYMPQWDLKDAYAMLESPEAMTPRGRHKRKPSLPLDELLSHNLSMAVKNSEALQAAPRGEDAISSMVTQQQQNDQNQPQEPAHGPLRGVVIATAKKLIANQSEYNNIAASLGADYRWTYDSSVTHYIFVGRQNDTNREFRKARDDAKCIVSSHWLLMCQEQNCRVDESLFPHTYNPNMSLSISSSMKTPVRSTRSSARGSRLRSRKDNDSPETITLAVPTPQMSRVKAKSSEESSEVGESGTSTEGDETKEVEEDSKTGGDSLVQGLKSLMAATKTYGKRSRGSLRRNDSFDSAIEEPNSSKRNMSKTNSPQEEEAGSSKKGRLTRNNSKMKLPNVPTDTQMDPSQRYEVTWDDPAAREQQEMLAKDLAKHSESFSPYHNAVTENEEEDEMEEGKEQEPEETAPTMKTPSSSRHKEDGSSNSKEVEEKTTTPESAPPLAFPRPRGGSKGSPPRAVELMRAGEEEEEDPDETKDVIAGEGAEGEEEERRPLPVILMSGLKPEERTDYSALVEQIGGQVLEAAHFDTQCTHLIVALPTRNEKYLASVAAGKWVLHKSYLEASRSQSAFVTETGHEWGTDATAHLLQRAGASTGKLAAAAHRWRKLMTEKRKLNPDCKGAFDGWTVILLSDRKKEEGFKRLLEAGGAKVIATKPPFTSLESVTHAFMDLAKLKFSVDVDVFVNAGIPCLKAEYIAAYLMDDPAPQLDEYYIPEVAAFMQSGNESKKRRARESLPSTPSKRTRR